MTVGYFIDENDKNALKDNPKIELDDIDQPNLLRDMFPYTEVPKIFFEKKTVPIDPPEQLLITDTTFRDGQQGHKPLSVEHIVNLYSLLHELGGKKGIIRQSEFFVYSKKDKQALDACRKKGFDYPEITSWIRANKEDFKLVKQLEMDETGILTSASDYHIFLKLKWTRKKAMENYLDIARSAIASEIIPRCHFEDVTRADIYGFVLPLAKELMKLQEETGMKVKIRLCDTMGFGISNEYAVLPRSVPKLIYSMIYGAGVPKDQLEWHGHNDFYRVHTNAVSAWLHGCAAVNGSLLGYGERTGNTPIEALCIEYAQLTGKTDGMDLTKITDIAEYFTKRVKTKIARTKPFVGSEFNMTRAGIHADGLLKNEEIYNIFDTLKILKRPVQVAITDKSGMAGLVYKINEIFELERKIDKTEPGLEKIYDHIMLQYRDGRTTAISDDELTSLVAEFMPRIFKCDYPARYEPWPKD
ncbi:MAG: 2-isopropylmalate synthase [archaeon]